MNKTLTFWTLVVFAIFFGLVWFPWTGFYLMRPIFPRGIGFMPHIVALALFFDILSKKAPKRWLIIPLLPYLIYYGYFFAEMANIKSLEAEFRNKNPSEIIAYNPDIHSLILESSMVGHYKIPVSYFYNIGFPEGFLSHRLTTKDLCVKSRGVKELTYTHPVLQPMKGMPRYYSKPLGNVCDFEMPEKPTKQLLKVEKKEDNDNTQKLQKTSYKFTLDEKDLGEYTDAYYYAPLSFPQFTIGCGLNSGSAEWKCVARLNRERMQLDTFPANGINDNQVDWVVARLLNIKKYTEDELNNFKDYPETKQILELLIAQKENETPDDFDEWGLRKDSLYQPKIGEKDGYPSFEGVVYTGTKGGPFRKFMEQHEGQIVYLDIDGKSNARLYSIINSGVCKVGEQCNNRTDSTYKFTGMPNNEGGEGKFKGLFSVGSKTLFENEYNKGDNDTITTLTFVPPGELK